MEALDGTFSIFRMSCGTPTEGDSTELELALGQVVKLRKELDLYSKVSSTFSICAARNEEDCWV
jgi:hypothetical protein